MEENLDAASQYKKLETLGKKLFAGQKLTQETIGKEQVELAEKFLSQGAKETNPEVLASYWEHVLLSPELGKRIAEKMGSEPAVNPNAVEFLLFLHDIGRLLSPSEYFRNDLIGDRLLLATGLSKDLIADLPPLGRISVLADEEEFTNEQLNFSESLTKDQEETIQKYFLSLTPTQRIINLADNLGKRNGNGIFNLAAFEEYLKTQEKRYEHESRWACVHWAIARRRGAALLQYYLVKKTIDWLESLGVEIGKILESLKDYGPKFVLIIRHGELENPKNVAYNRDSVMNESIHLSSEGKTHLQTVGQIIKTKGFNLTKIFTSPETRALESSEELKTKLFIPVETAADLDEVLCPYPYAQNWSMDKLVALNGKIYNLPGTENPEEVVKRMRRFYDGTANELKVGEAAILVSHGDPIVFLIHHLETNSVADPKFLRDIIYPAKGQVTVTIIGTNGKLFALYLLNEDL
jgi:broad specificity phosphatase PhoE